jgi:hypothetical protein
MSRGWWWVILGGAVIAGLAALLPWRRRSRFAGPPAADRARARDRFLANLPALASEFRSAAGRHGKPRGLVWLDCELADDIVLAVDRSTGQLRALVSVTIRFEAVPGGELEDNPNVDQLRAATAVFLYDGGTWRTEGRAVFNLDARQTLEHFQHELRGVA